MHVRRLATLYEPHAGCYPRRMQLRLRLQAIMQVLGRLLESDKAFRFRPTFFRDAHRTSRAVLEPKTSHLLETSMAKAGIAFVLLRTIVIVETRQGSSYEDGRCRLLCPQ